MNRSELENELAAVMRKKQNAIEILVGRLSSVVTTEQLAALVAAERGTQ
jgi:hypothetical protein